ncbi:N-acetylneuraminate synthase family protein [Candidatus Nitrosopelagicus sp.]|nr:N-acetylneuraminate synthase family protein [Candidatus Nitrosopelagicus sp.]
MVFVVAEIGVNWNGDFELLEEMIKQSKNAGCNAVKLQAFSENEVKQHPDKEILLSCSVNSDNVKQINKIASDNGIEWFCTPMYEKAVDFLDPYVNRYKIRHADGIYFLEDKESVLLRKVLDTGKQVIVSSEMTPKSSKYFSNKQISWLYCVPKYPTSFKEIDFKNIRDFDGYSNHTPNFMAPLTAAILGAQIIEVHITSDKTKKFFDNNVSFDYNELEYLVRHLRVSKEIRK